MNDAEKNYCTLYIVRHGETEWNVSETVMGQLDSPLTDRGIQQAEQVGNEIGSIHFDAVYSSDLLRAKRTAEIILLEKEIAITTSKLLRERRFGKFEGKKSTEYRLAIKHLLEKMERLAEPEKWTFKFAEDMESDHELVTRFLTFVREVAAANPKKTILIVTHGGCIRTFLIHIGYTTRQGFPAGSFANGGYVKVLSDGTDFFVKNIKGLKSTA